MRKSVIKEGSVLTFGAMGNCRTEAFEIVNNKNNNSNLVERDIMAEKNAMTIDSFKADHGDIFNEVSEKGKAEGLAEGEKAARDGFAKVVKLCDGDNDLAVECFTAGKTDVEVLQAKNAKLAAANETLTEKNSKLVKKTAAGDDHLAVQEFSDDAGDENNKGKKLAADQTDDELKTTFAESSDLQTEFGSDNVADYIAFVKAEKNGTAKIRKP